MSTEYLSIPGFLPIKQAAEMLGLSDKRVLQYILADRLPARKVGGRYLMPIEAVSAFEPHPHGRIRTSPVSWRRYRAGAVVYLRRIVAPVLAGCEQALNERITAISDRQEHTFPGTMQRFVWSSDGMFSVVLIWKSTEASPASLDRDMGAFRGALADLINWDKATTSTSEVGAHT